MAYDDQYDPADDTYDYADEAYDLADDTYDQADETYDQTDDGQTNDSNMIESNWFMSDEGISSYSVVFLSLLALVLILSKCLHDVPKLAAIVPEAGMIIIVGIIAGYLIYLATPLSSGDDQGGDDDSMFNSEVSQFVAMGLLSFSPKVFFFVLLPPIIFNSGYNLKRGVFFRHITPISLFACFGSAISTFVVAIMLDTLKGLNLTGGFNPHFTELLAFGALISATDPVSTLAVFQAKKVDPQLFYLVFGESVLNDAVGLVLFKTLSKFVGDEDSADKIMDSVLEFLLDFSVSFAGSMALGLFAGLATAFFFKKVDMRGTPILELSLFLLIMYMPFFASELIELSGIVTILFTGISTKRYATQNLSESTQQNVDALFRVTAHLAEATIFIDLGLSVFGLSFVSSKWIFAGWAILACLIGRALNIYPLRALYNRSLLFAKGSNRQRPIIVKQQSRNEFESINDAGTDIPSVPSMTHSVTPVVKKDLKIRNNTAHMLWFSGLRGAVAYACAKTFPDHYGNRDYFVFTTMVIVLFTVYVFGCSTEFALKYLEIEINVDENAYMEENNTEMKMITLNTIENRYIFPFIVRHDENGEGVEMQSSENWASNSKASGQFRDLNHPSASFAERKEWAIRRRESLYDYGLGASSRMNPSFSTCD